MRTISDEEIIGKKSTDKRSEFRGIENLFLIFMVCSQVYYWYRYALQVGSAGTSPTYDNTPIELQVGKYLMAIGYVGILFVMVSPSIHSFRLRNVFVGVFVVVFLFFGVLLSKYEMASDADDKAVAIGLIKAAYVGPLVAVSMPFLASPGFYKKFELWAVDIPMIYHIIYSMVQIGLYYAIGRLPSQGYANFLIRFGGGWDDPNGFALFLSLPFLYLLASHHGGVVKKVFGSLYGVTIVILLALTVSYSGIATFGIACLVCVALVSIRLTLMALSISIIAGTAVAFSPTLLSQIEFNMEQKQNSMDSHIDQLSAIEGFFDSDIFTILFGRGEMAYLTENFYESILLNFGLITFLIMALGICVTIFVGIKKYYRAKRLQEEESARLLLIGVCFLTAFSLGSNLIPFFMVYPVNLYFWFYSILMWTYPVSARAIDVASLT